MIMTLYTCVQMRIAPEAYINKTRAEPIGAERGCGQSDVDVIDGGAEFECKSISARR